MAVPWRALIENSRERLQKEAVGFDIVDQRQADARVRLADAQAPLA